MLEDFLSKMGASTKITVGVAISPNIGLEMIQLDRTTGTIEKYSSKPLEYNHSTREIEDYTQFELALSELFSELRIPQKSNIILSIPNIHFGLITLPLLLTDEAITNAIISEVEQSYIFKRQEPVVSWSEIYSNMNTENRLLAYTAIQKRTLDKITEAFDSLGCTIVGIDNSYATLLKALSFSNLTKTQMKDNVTWNLMIIGQNNYSIISMADKKVMEYYEEPLALKSFINDEIYNAIATSAKLTLSNLPANYLYIVSETDLVSAEVLAMRIPFDGTVNFLECNKFVQTEILPVNLNILPKMAMQITPEAIGAATYNFIDFPLKFNMQKTKVEGVDSYEEIISYPRIPIGNLEVELTPAFLKRIIIILGGIITVPILILLLLLNTIILPKEKYYLQEIESKIETINEEIKKYDEKEKTITFDLKSSIDKILIENKNKITYYQALGISIPNKLWITHYLLKDSGKIDIQGSSNDVESIYDFYKNLKQLVNNSNIRLYKLEIDSESIDDVIADVNDGSRTYKFEITNMSQEELEPKTEEEEQNADTPSEPKEEKKSFFGLGKPILDLGFKENKSDSENASHATSPPSNLPQPPTENTVNILAPPVTQGNNIK
jgi:hypothetical protein